MTQQNTQTPKRHLPRLDGWSVMSALIAILVLAPIVSVVWIALHPTENIWPHLLATVMPRYMAATLTMMLGVGLITAAVGTGAAWLVTLYRFPGSGWLTWALLFPLAVPAYVGAYALLLSLIDFLLMGIDKGRAKGGGWRIPERVLLGLRTVEGVPMTVLARLGLDGSGGPVADLIGDGFLENVSGRIRATPRGRPVLDSVLKHLLT